MKTRKSDLDLLGSNSLLSSLHCLFTFGHTLFVLKEQSDLGVYCFSYRTATLL